MTQPALQKAFRLFGFSLILLFPSACDMLNQVPASSGGASTLARPFAAQGTMNKQQAMALLQTSGNLISSYASVPSFLNGSVANSYAGTSAIGQRAYATQSNLGAPCVPQASGNTADTDHDGIPADETFTYSCPGSSNALGYSVSGTLELSDQSDSLPFPQAGFTVTLNNMAIGSFLPDYTPETITLNGTESLAVDSTSTTFSQSITAGIQIGSTEGQVGSWLNGTVNPTPAPSPAPVNYGLNASGTVLFSGFYGVNSDSANFTVTVAANNITYGNCTNGSFYNTGDIVFQDGAKNTFTIHYNKCLQTSDYNGTVIAFPSATPTPTPSSQIFAPVTTIAPPAFTILSSCNYSASYSRCNDFAAAGSPNCSSPGITSASACSATNRVGSCELTNSTILYYSTGGTPYTTATAQQACNFIAGYFVPN